MAPVNEPVPAEQPTILPASEASWDDLATIFGITHAGECQWPLGEKPLES